MTNGIYYLFRTFCRGLLNSINIPGKKTLIDAQRASNFRDIQPWETFEYLGDEIVCIWLSRDKETADVDVFVNVIPVDIISIKTNFIFGPLFRRGI